MGMIRQRDALKESHPYGKAGMPLDYALIVLHKKRRPSQTALATIDDSWYLTVTLSAATIIIA
jgi:hypothetical protein